MDDRENVQVDAALDAANSHAERARIFISYKRDVAPDEPLATRVYNALSPHHDVFIDQTMVVGTHWAETIEMELSRSDFLISFLSANSVQSEMVKVELTTAHRVAEKREGRPIILPVRVAYKEPFAIPISAILDPINWAYWGSEEDTEGLVTELERALGGGILSVDKQAKPQLLEVSKPEAIPIPQASAQPIRLETPGGAVDPESHFYVKRLGDRTAVEVLDQRSVTIVIKAPRQMGKSSLLFRIMHEAQEADKQVAFLDLQMFGEQTLRDRDLFYREFCRAITDALEMDDRTDAFWESSRVHNIRVTKYLNKYVLPTLKTRLLLAMDEVDCLLDSDFRTDFFAMLRSWHNRRAREKIWRKLELALVTSTEPHLLIKKLHQSPFNVGEIIELTDFTAEQVADLNQRHGSSLTDEDLCTLMKLLAGHPYLVRRALYLVARKRTSAKDLFAQATQDRGPFGDHLKHYFFLLHGKEDLLKGLREVIHHNVCSDELVLYRLQGAGLVRREGHTIRPRCQLYADYFQERLYG